MNKVYQDIREAYELFFFIRERPRKNSTNCKSELVTYCSTYHWKLTQDCITHKVIV